LIIIVLSVVIWPDRMTGWEEKRDRPKGFCQRILPKHDYDGKLRVSQAARPSHSSRAVLRKWFSAVYDATTSLPPSFASSFELL
jgi:hypothetical protein